MLDSVAHRKPAEPARHPTEAAPATEPSRAAASLRPSQPPGRRRRFPQPDLARPIARPSQACQPSVLSRVPGRAFSRPKVPRRANRTESAPPARLGRTRPLFLSLSWDLGRHRDEAVSLGSFSWVAGGSVRSVPAMRSPLIEASRSASLDRETEASRPRLAATFGPHGSNGSWQGRSLPRPLVRYSDPALLRLPSTWNQD